MWRHGILTTGVFQVYFYRTRSVIDVCGQKLLAHRINISTFRFDLQEVFMLKKEHSFMIERKLSQIPGHGFGI